MKNTEDVLREAFNKMVDEEFDNNTLCGYTYRQWTKPEAIEFRKTNGFKDFELGYNFANNDERIVKLKAAIQKMLNGIDFAIDDNYSRKTANNRLKECRKEAIKILLG